MKIINEKQTQYESLMEFAVLGGDDELLNPKTLITTKKIKRKKVNQKETNK